MKNCMVKDCVNTSDKGTFFGNICGPCYHFITSGVGTNNQVVRNASALLTRRFAEKITQAKLSTHAAACSLDEAMKLIKEEM